MMKRYLLSIILGFFAMANISIGQLEIIFSEETANVGGTVDVDLTVNGFTDISVLQFSAGWDSLVMNFNSVVFTNPDLSDLSESSISGPQGASNIDPGQFTFSYGSPTGNGNLPDGSILFTVRFDIAGEECDETPIVLTGDPTSIEAHDADFNELTVSSQDGNVMVNGTDCNGTGGGDELTITAPMLDADMGTNICIPLNVLNFIGVQAGSGTILWDPTVLSYTGLANININGVDGSLNDTNVENGELLFVWSNPDPANPLTIEDGNPIFEICFDVIGDPGDMSPITLSTDGNLGFEWTDDNEEVIPQLLVDGKVTVTESVEDPFTLNISDITVEENDTNVCVDITVENFTDIISMQFVITWDGTLLSNATPSNFMLTGLNASSFNVDGDCATLSWSGISGTTLSDGSKIFSMCFDVIGECDNTSPVDIVSKGSTNIEIIDEDTNEVSGVTINSGSIFIDCEPETCEVVSVDNTCIGELGGNITVNVPTENCSYSWADSNGNEVATTQNLLGVGAGTYILTVSCDGAEVCTLSETISNFPDLTIGSTITNAACGDLGAIDVSVSGGSGDYAYNWNPAQGDTPNISNLEAATYALTVTDNVRGCTKTASFEVLNEVDELEIATSVVVDETCVQNDGRISLTISGGCQPYTFTWADDPDANTPNRVNLPAGNYQVTVTDDSDPALTVTGSFTVDGTDPITQVGSATIVPSSGTNGSVTIEVTGGNPDYSYSWSGPTTGLPNSNMITNLMPGDYSVTVTDSDGCTAEFGPFNVLIVNDEEDEPVIDNVGAENNTNGFAIRCNGGTTGVITGFVSQGLTPLTIELSGDASETIIAENLGTFSFDTLPAGTYTVTVTNTAGTVSVENILVTEPEAIVVDVDSGCDSEEQCDGFIDLDISGGFGVYNIDWGSPDLVGESLDNLCMDSYTATITDENECIFMVDVDIESCEGPVDPDCYQVRDVISPNGDGMNDQFLVSCINDFPASLEVYDRWGKLVYNQNPYDGSWMGVSNSNEELIEGGYMYIINIDFGQGRREIMKGTLTLLRD